MGEIRDCGRRERRSSNRWIPASALLGGLAACVVPAAGAAAQALPPLPPELEQVAWLEGDWRGSGWMEFAPGQRATFGGTERVEWRMGDRLIVIEGSFEAEAGPRGRIPVHQALGILSYDPGEGKWEFRTYTAQGARGEAHAAEVSEGKVVWGYDDPRRGRVRYTIRETADGAWHEVGHASRDNGETWEQFFEMTLRRDP